MKRICFSLVVLFLLTFAPALVDAFDLSVIATGGLGQWQDGVYEVTVGATVSFSCTPSNGTSPYSYSWDFDDVNSYVTATTTQNPSHTFNYPGTHHVWVTVTDNASAVERGALLIRVNTIASIPTVDAISDCSLDNSGTNDCNAALETCILHNYSGGLRVEFPAGTYRFDDATKGSGANQRYCGINARDRNIEFVRKSTAATQPILKYYGILNSGKSWDCFIYARSSGSTHRLLLKDLNIQLDQDPDNYTANQLVIGDADAATTYVTIEDCTITNFPKIAQTKYGQIKRCNATGFGTYNSGTRVELIRHTDYGLSVRGYYTTGQTNHSKIWYFTDVQHTYIIDNYADIDNADSNQNVIQCKKNMQNSSIEGNLFKNSKGLSILLVVTIADSEIMTNYDVKDNRIIAGGGQGGIILQFGNNCDVQDNFFHGFAVGNYACLQSGDVNVACENVPSTSGNTFSGNICGAGAPGGTASMYRCSQDEICNPPLGCGGFSNAGNTDDNSTTKTGDPLGWISGGAYHDPGPYEYIPPTNCLVAIVGGAYQEGDVSLILSATDSGSGMGSNARFPFKEGGLMQFSNDGVMWSEVRPYAESTIWTLPSGPAAKTVYARFRDRDGNWSLSTHSGIPPRSPNLRIK